MSRDDGFPVMDVSTDYLNDPKWRRLHRAHPELFPVAFVAFTAAMAESWKAGHRVSVEDAWSPLLPFSSKVIEALREAGFIDRRNLVIVKSWDGWFLPAFERRAKSRARWRRQNEKRDADTAVPPRGTDADTTTSVPSVPPVRPSAPSGPPEPPKEYGFYPVDEQGRITPAFPPIGTEGQRS